MSYTEHLEDFGEVQLNAAADLLYAAAKGYPSDFWADGVKLAFNSMSGFVFLTNDNYDVCMEADGELYTFYTTPYEGIEGFLWELVDDYLADPESWNEEDVEWLRELCSDDQIVVDNDLLEEDVEKVLANK